MTTLADEVALLWMSIGAELHGELHSETLARLDRILALASQVPQRAMDGRAPVWQHSCGRIITCLDPGPNWCSVCDDPTPWQPLYVLADRPLVKELTT